MDSFNLKGFKGEISDVQEAGQKDTGLPKGPDFVEMAKKGLHYLANNPDKENNYDSRFCFFLLCSKPFTYEWDKVLPDGKRCIDVIALGDTESRNDIAFSMMREIAGSDYGKEVEDIVRNRLISYIRPDDGRGRPGTDMCWVYPYCCSSDVDTPAALAWTTQKLVMADSIRFKNTRDEKYLLYIKRLMKGLKNMAEQDTGRAFYPDGFGTVRDDGRRTNAFPGHYPTVVDPALSYWEATGDKDALEFAGAIVEGFIADLQPDHQRRPDGSVLGHNHLVMHGIKGVARFGYLTGDWRTLEWAKQAYDFYSYGAMDNGWLPECLWMKDHNYHSETCLTADMLETEIWLASSGRPEYWDSVERSFRNYIVPAQFEVTKEFMDLWMRINGSKPEKEIEAAIDLLKSIEGGFVSAFTPNDMVFEVKPEDEHAGYAEFEGRKLVLDMMGCCPPEGMRAIYYTSKNTVQEKDKGIFVNMAFDVDGHHAKVESYVPEEGRIRVTAKTARDFWLRPPSWAPRGRVEAKINGRFVEPRWGGPAYAYISFPDVKPGEVMEISWPIVTFTQKIKHKYMLNDTGTCFEYNIKSFEGQEYEYKWHGNNILSVSPEGKWLGLYKQKNK